jgi:hypothetical protein
MYIERPSLVRKGLQVRVWIAPQGLRYEYAPSLEGFLLSEPVTIGGGRTSRDIKVPSKTSRDFDTLAVVYSNGDHSILSSLSTRLNDNVRSLLLSLAQSKSPFDMVLLYGDGEPNDINDYNKLEIFKKARVNVYTHDSPAGFGYDPSDVMERIEFYVDEYNDYSKPEIVKETTTSGRVTDVKIINFNMCVQCMESAGGCEYYPVIASTVVYQIGTSGEALYLLVSHNGGKDWTQHQLAIGLFGEPKIVVQGTRVIVLPDSDIAGQFYYIDGKHLLSNTNSATREVTLPYIDSFVNGGTTAMGDSILIARNKTAMLIKAGKLPESAIPFTDFKTIDIAVDGNDVFLLGDNEEILWLHGTERAVIKTNEQFNELWVGEDLSLFGKGSTGEVSWYKPGKGSWHATGWTLNDMSTSDGITYKVDDFGLHESHDALNSSGMIDAGQYLYVDTKKGGQQLAYATDSNIYISLGTIEQMKLCPYDNFIISIDTPQVYASYICDNGDFKLSMHTAHEPVPGGILSYQYTITGATGVHIIYGDEYGYAELPIPIPTTSAGAMYNISSVVTWGAGSVNYNSSTIIFVPCNVIDCGDGSCIECYNKVALESPDCCF